MALELSTREKCSCFSPDDFGDLSSKQREGLEILHQREGVITEAECKRIGSSHYYYSRHKVVVQIILDKSISESLKICEICEQYELLDSHDIDKIKVLVDVYHNEQLVTNKEAEEASSHTWNWGEVAVVKDVSTASKIADILNKYGSNDVAQHIKVLVDVYHKEKLVTKEEVDKVASDDRRWGDIAVIKDVSTAMRIAEILDKYDRRYNIFARHIRVLVDVYHKEQLVTKEEAEEAASNVWGSRWKEVVVTKDGVTARRIAGILDKYGFNDVAQYIRVLVDVYHEEQLLTKNEAKEAASDQRRMEPRLEWRWINVAVAKDDITATRIANILDKKSARFNDVVQHIRVLVDVYHKEQLVTKEEAEKAASRERMWIKVAATKDDVTATRIADILDKYGFNYSARHIRVLVDVYHKEQLVTKEEAKKAASAAWRLVEVSVTKDDVTATRIADILDKYDFNDVAQHIRVLVDVYHKEQLVTKEEAEKAASDIGRWKLLYKEVVTKDSVTATKIAGILDKYGLNDDAQHIRAHSRSLDPTSEQYTTSDTSLLDTSVSKTSPDIDSNEPKSQEKATVTSELDTKSKKESYVGKLSVTVEVQSNLTYALKTFDLLCHNMSHEAVLSRNCWLPFGYYSVTVDRRGGTYDLCSDGLTKLAVPRNAVRGETAEIRYAIIGKGPFQLPPNYQLGSFVVYVHYNPEEITTPVTLSLSTWYGGDVVPGEPPPDSLSFAVAPHILGLQDTHYTFQLVDGGEFRDSRVHNVSIEGHSSLYTIVFKEGANILYLATHLMVKKSAEETTHRIFVTYFSRTWSKIFKAIYKKATLEEGQHFQFENPPSDPSSGKLVAEVGETRGNGWAVTITGSPKLRQTDVSYEQYGFPTAKEFESAVKGGLYPPKLTFRVTNTVGRNEPATPKYVNFTIQGANEPLQFSACVKERISGNEQRTPHSSASSERRSSSSPNPPTPSLYTPVFDSGQFMDNFKQRFLAVVAAKGIAEKLDMEDIIPESVYRHIVREQTTNNDANLKLFRHLHQHGDLSIIRSLCDIMIKERGYPKMNALGREMSEHTSLPPF